MLISFSCLTMYVSYDDHNFALSAVTGRRRQMTKIIYLTILSFMIGFLISGRTLIIKHQQRLKFITPPTIASRKVIEGYQYSLRMCTGSSISNETKNSAGRGLLLRRLKKRSMGTTVAVEKSGQQGTIDNNLVNTNFSTLNIHQNQMPTELDSINHSDLGKALYINTDDHVNNIQSDDNSSGAGDSTNDLKIVKEENKPFSSLDVSCNTKKAIEHVLKYEIMTQVQQEAIPAVLTGADVFAKARTGTGKTLAFLIPGIEMLLKELHRYAKRTRADKRQGNAVKESLEKPLLLILSPTRELAMQIAAEAKLLLTYHKLKVVTTVGGVDMAKDVRALNKPEGFDIIVATPGRFLAHLKETHGVAAKMKGVKFLVLDEADRLLDMGFSRDINKIASYLPSREKGASRQTFLFSATFSDEIKEVARTFLRQGYTIVDTVGEEVEQTHSHVPQSIVSVPTGDQVEALKFLLESEMSNNPRYKIMVFFPTARQTGYMAALFRLAKMDILEIHSRKSQAQRTKTSETFRASTRGIIFSSDVTARGMDYPDVTLVIQMGMTQRDQYIHRLGRTARAGKEGTGVLVLHPSEYRFMNNELSDMPLKVIPTEAIIAPIDEKPNSYNKMMAESSILDVEAAQSWQAWLGFYNGQTKKLGWSTQDLLQEAKSYANSMGLDDIPALPRRTLSKMGLAKAEGFKSEEHVPRQVRNRHPNDKGRDGKDRGRSEMDYSSRRGGSRSSNGLSGEQGRGRR